MLAVETRFHPTNVDLIYSRYRRHGDLSMDESFFPVLWDRDGGRTPGSRSSPTSNARSAADPAGEDLEDPPGQVGPARSARLTVSRDSAMHTGSRGLGDHVRGARPPVQHRHLAEELAGAEPATSRPSRTTRAYPLRITNASAPRSP